MSRTVEINFPSWGMGVMDELGDGLSEITQPVNRAGLSLCKNNEGNLREQV